MYIIENLGGRFYVGHTSNLPRRLAEHTGVEKDATKYTHKHGPWRLVWSEPHPDRSAAMSRERFIKSRKSAAWIRKPLSDLGECLNQLADGPKPQRALLLSVAAMIPTWFLYVPIHELMHAGGCLVPGGSVTQLEIAPQDGGALLAQWIPWVVSGSDYAGRLSGFDTAGSDWIYLATDFGPFLLTVLFGVAIIKVCGKRRRPVLLGIGVVIGLAPFYNVIGDYYEMGSIMVTATATMLMGNGDAIAFEGIRSDDVFKLFGTLFTAPSELGLSGAGAISAGIALAILSQILAVVLAFITYAMGSAVASLYIKPAAYYDERLK